ncbi:YkgJ family cysteine cluster protein [Poseidonibacter lekithochrous]|uniref:YkgJ family cysteine cluster protein n=1 Tax=Poseidonibacter lekithochrous TaxID=1904463 RepID=UPI0008FC5DD0|nr:YkgJ family cysteine cluster protein [Poseidonibacter lekithochrous]QKJ23727.1 putative [Fe-S] cluster-containing protein [Poseidonibacter lekithochrous]
MNNLIKQEGYPYGFDPSGCEACGGNCCIGESGYIWINPKEIEFLSKHLNITLDEVRIKFLEKKGYKYSIKEIQLDVNNYACTFFDLEKKQCSIYEARPIQCRTFPFWEYFKENVNEVYKECPAIKNI